MTQSSEKTRIDYLDVLRVLATFMVIMAHVGDAYLYDAQEGSFGNEVSAIVMLIRPAVPLFIIMSSILLLPLRRSNTGFLKRRFSRVFVPFFLWSIIYVFLPLPNELAFGGPENVFTDSGMNVYLYNLLMIPFNFTGSNVHFWFIYIILGLYLFMPIISPWLKTAGKKSLLYFLGLWTITLFFPYLRLFFPEIHGESDWSNFGMFYYFGGYFGYVVLGYFLHHYNRLSAQKSVAIGAALLAVGGLITYFGFIHDQNLFLSKLSASAVEDWKLIEFNIGYLKPNVVLMTAGIFMMFQNIKLSGFAKRMFTEMAVFSYGIFLVHYIITLWLGPGLKGTFGINPGIEQIVVTIIVFLVSYALVKLISFIPKSKYLIG